MEVAGHKASLAGVTVRYTRMLTLLKAVFAWNCTMPQIRAKTEKRRSYGHGRRLDLHHTSTQWTYVSKYDL